MIQATKMCDDDFSTVALQKAAQSASLPPLQASSTV
jgi:hypothetical protein